MGTGRGRAALSLILLALPLALFAGGCGAEDHPNNPRPPQAVEVTVSIADGRLSVQPHQVGFTDADSNQQMSQNLDEPQAQLPSSTPMTVSFTVSNLTDYDTALQIEGPTNETTPKTLAQNANGFKVDLPTGDYFIYANGVPGTPSTNFSIGPKRPSSQNDLLLP